MAAFDAAMADAPEPDREWMARPEVRKTLVEGTREAFANGPEGWFDDAWALSTDWGFALGDVAAPVWFWYGELDRNVPIGAVRQMTAQLTSQHSTSSPARATSGGSSKRIQVLRTTLLAAARVR